MDRAKLQLRLREIHARPELGTFEGIASAFDTVIEGGGGPPTIIERGSFAVTIMENKHRIKLLWMHKLDEPIGRPIEMRENQDGLFIKGRIADTPRGREAMGLLTDGVIDEMSIGFDPVTADYRDNEHRRIRHITQLKLWEVSLVTWGANPAPG